MKFKKLFTALGIILLIATLAYGATVSVRPNGIAFPYWYGYSAGAKASHYLSMPTLSANDEACGIATTQTLTNKTLTSPTITAPTITGAGTIAATSVTTTGDVTVNGNLAGDGATVLSAMLRDTETVAATNVITAAECGSTFFLNHATEFASTLPALSTVSAGCYFKFVVVGAPSGANYTIITGNSLENGLHGGINELEVDTNDDGPSVADGDTITIVQAVAVEGDWVEMISDGTSWYFTGQTVADGGMTATQAD